MVYAGFYRSCIIFPREPPHIFRVCPSFSNANPYKKCLDGLVCGIQYRIGHDLFLPSCFMDSNGTPVTGHVPPAQAGAIGSVTALDMWRLAQSGIKAENLPAVPPAMINKI